MILGVIVAAWMIFIRPQTIDLRETYLSDSSSHHELSKLKSSSIKDILLAELKLLLKEENHTDLNHPELLFSPASIASKYGSRRFESILTIINDVTKVGGLSDSEKKIVGTIVNAKINADALINKRIIEISQDDYNMPLLQSAEYDLTQEEISQRQKVIDDINSGNDEFEKNRKNYQDTMRNSLPSEKLSKIKSYEVERAKSERNSAIKIFADYVRNKGFNFSENSNW